MSADNWAVCPRCARARAAELQAEGERVEQAYGKVSIPEFDEMRAAFAARAMEPITATFREDYEFYGVDEGELHISYQGGCKVCGLSLKYSHSEPLDVDGPATS